MTRGGKRRHGRVSRRERDRCLDELAEMLGGHGPRKRDWCPACLARRDVLLSRLGDPEAIVMTVTDDESGAVIIGDVVNLVDDRGFLN